MFLHSPEFVRSILVWLGFSALCCAADQPTLRVCADPNNLPFSNQSGEGLENKLAQIIAHDLSVNLTFVWFSERRNFLKNALGGNLCDAILGVPVDMNQALLTRPYYSSTYVVVTRADSELKIDSLYDPRLKELRIGLHRVGDDYVPPGHLLAALGLSGQIVSYSLYGAYGEINPPARLIEGIEKNEIDLAIAWGPLAGYFASKSPVGLVIERVSPKRYQMVPFTYSIGVAVRKGDVALQSAIQHVLDRECAKIQALIKEYAFPSPEEDQLSCAPSPSAAAFFR